MSSLDLSHSEGIAFYWWGSGGLDQNIDFEMWSPTGGWIGRFPDGPAEWRWIFLRWSDLTEVDLDGSRPDSSDIRRIYWTYHTEGIRRVDYIVGWRTQDLPASFEVGQGFKDLYAKFVVMCIAIYIKDGTSGAAAALLTEQTIPEMEQTITAGAGDSIIVYCDCRLSLGPGNSDLSGELPYAVTEFDVGVSVPPTDLENITDGDDGTSATTAVVEWPGFGRIYYDVGSEAKRTLRLRIGIWRTAGTATVYVTGSNNGVDWVSFGMTGGSSSGTEEIITLSAVQSYRYYRIWCSQGSAGIGYFKIYTFSACKGDIDEPPYLAIWPEVNGVELTPRGVEYDVLANPIMFPITRAYTIPSDGDYTIAIKWQEFQRVAGDDTYESYYQITDNNRQFILEHVWC